MTCRICKNSYLRRVIDLGEQVITSRFPEIGDYSTPKTHITLGLCLDCGLLQLENLVDSSEMYEHLYGYRSGLNEMMRTHLQEYNTELQSKLTLQEGDAVLDIGSNDATFLSIFPSYVRRVGCDPTGKQFAEFYTDKELVPTYFSQDVVPQVKYKTVSSISMFYDLPDPVQFAQDIYNVLADDGIWTLEQSYVLTMLEQNSIDTICHEHVEYYGLRQIKNIMDRVGFKIIDVSKNSCNGGSIRVYVAKKTSSYPEAVDIIQQYLENEGHLMSPQVYIDFFNRCKAEADKLKDFVSRVKTYVYGASTKGNCLLQFANITPDLVKYAVERNPLKYGKMTSTGIPIISEEEMRKDPPHALLVLPWHFRESILLREKMFQGMFVFPFPNFEFVQNTYSQAYQDSVVNKLTENIKTTKRFLDIGASNAFVNNNTILLEQNGWKGLCIDMMNDNSYSNRQTPFLCTDVTTIFWNAFLPIHYPEKFIDYISFDVDDASDPAFDHFPFKEYRFRIMTIEHDEYRVGTAFRDKARKYLSSLGYTLLCESVVCENYGAFEDWWVDASMIDKSFIDKLSSCKYTPSRSIRELLG